MKKLILIALMLISIASATEKPTCKGKTKANETCKSVFVMKDGFCSHHNPNSLKCGFIKADGQPCKMTVKEIGTKCHHHKNK